MNHSDDALTRLLERADPAPAAADPLLVEHTWAVLEAELVDDPVVVPLRSKRRAGRAAVVGTVAVVALAVSAGAAFVATRTGEWNPAEWISAGGPGENYRLDGTDFPARLAELAVDIPYPDEASRAANLAAIIAENADHTEPAEASTGALRAELARGAICSWTMAWQRADTADGRASVVTALRGALTWPAVTAVDPTPAIDGHPSVAGPQPTVFGHLPVIIEAAASGDADRLTKAVDESAYCATATWSNTGAEAVPPSPPSAAPVPTTVP